MRAGTNADQKGWNSLTYSWTIEHISLTKLTSKLCYKLCYKFSNDLLISHMFLHVIKLHLTGVLCYVYVLQNSHFVFNLYIPFISSYSYLYIMYFVGRSIKCTCLRIIN